jgi:hypothetical protein
VSSSCGSVLCMSDPDDALLLSGNEFVSEGRNEHKPMYGAHVVEPDERLL